MAAITKISRVALYPSCTASSNILLKCFSYTSDGDNDDNYWDKDKKPCPPLTGWLCCDTPSSSKPSNCYDSRKYGHGLPGSTITPCFETLPQIPTDVFRCTHGECLGPQGHASKCGLYRNPEYFSYHHMSYHDMHLVLRAYRRKDPIVTGRKPF